jgi:serine/threonine-protein kinase
VDSLTDAAERVGSLVDERYKLLEVMAAGSMGAVYKAERVPVGKLVAVKFLHASFANDIEFQARFERETRVLSKLNHPNCVSVLDFGVWQNAPYLVMDFVAGTTLRALLDQAALPPQRALSLSRQIAAGLAHAHAEGIVHRDIKPANIMITEEIGHGERVRILDFGLARLRGNVGRDATQTNMVVGTPNYMAPEQTVPSANVDARADVYAVGVVLFEMVVGDRPFHAEDTLQLLGMHRAAPIPRLADRVKEGTELPDGLQELIDKAMAKSPDARYQSAIELAAAIDDVIAGKRNSEHDVTIPTTGKTKTKTTSPEAIAPTMVDLDTEADDEPRPRSRFWRTMLTAMVLVGGAAAMAGYLIHRNHGEVAPEAQKVAVAPGPSPAPATPDTPATPQTDTPAVDASVPSPANDAADVAAVPSPPIDAADVGAAPPTIDAAADVAEQTTGSGSAEEIEMDPESAEDLDPQKGSADQAVEEAADAPESGSAAAAKVHEPPEPSTATASTVPHQATTLHDALLLIKEGHRERALASLHKLAAKQKKSAYIPFLIGNLYADQVWWSAAMDEYGLAIKNNSQYRKNPTLIRNVIRMLASRKTQRQASGFLVRTVGHPAILLLKTAAARDPNSIVKQQASLLLRQIR